MNPHLKIIVGDRETRIEYMVDDVPIVSHMHAIGLKHIELEGMNKIAASKFLDGIMYTLEFISLHDRIPTDFKLISPRYATWIGESIEAGSYAQFYTDGAPVRVTLDGINDPSLAYARHTQAIHSFKI